MGSYSPEAIETALLELALTGSSLKASEKCGIPRKTLEYWRDTAHADRWQQIRDEAHHLVSKRVAAQAEEIMLQAGETELRLIERINQALDANQLTPKDLAAALRNITTTKALNQDKISAPLRGRPTIVEHRHTADDTLRKLTALGLIDLADSDVQDVTDAETPAIEAHTSQPKDH